MTGMQRRWSAGSRRRIEKWPRTHPRLLERRMPSLATAMILIAAAAAAADGTNHGAVYQASICSSGETSN